MEEQRQSRSKGRVAFNLEKELRVQDFICHGEDLFSKNEHEQMVKKGRGTGSSGSRQRTLIRFKPWQCSWTISNATLSEKEPTSTSKEEGKNVVNLRN